MMNVLLVNPRSPESYWSFYEVAKLLNKKALAPPLGLLTVAGLLPREWNLRLIDREVREVTEEDWDFCDLVLVSGMFSQQSGIIECIKQGKARGKTVAVGGPWVFHCPGPALDAGADIVVKGEGECTVPLLIDALSRKDSGIVITAQDRANITTSPPPRYDLLEMGLYLNMSLQFSRGCPFHCEFCDITYMFGRRVRTKSPQQILDELQILYDLGWRRAVFFVDDNLIGHQLKAKELLKELIVWQEQRGYPFECFTQASVNLATDDELLDLMARAGFFKVFLGIESTDRESLEVARKRQNTRLDLAAACEKINRAGLTIIAGCIIGFDNEKPGVDRRLIEFARRTQIPEMFVSLLQAGPGTDLWSRLQQEGRLLSLELTDDWGSQTGLMNFVPTRPMREIVDEFIRVYDELYDPQQYLERSFEHVYRMKSPPFKKSFALPYLAELRAVAITLIKYGVLYPHRRKFWSLLFRALFSFPDRIHHFLSYCVMADHLCHYRITVREAFLAQMTKNELRLKEEENRRGTCVSASQRALTPRE
jgi:radical SAM superfamily enzyme YgiQ (UPF0313 family)